MSALRPLPTRRLLAVFLAGLYVMGAFAGIVHVADVEHVRCPEHGEVMHGEVLHGEALARADVRVVFDEARLQAGERAEHHGEHDHCLVIAPSSQETLAHRHVDVVVPLDTAAPAPVVAHAAAPRSAHEALFRLAPKQGPPA